MDLSNPTPENVSYMIEKSQKNFEWLIQPL